MKSKTYIFHLLVILALSSLQVDYSFGQQKPPPPPELMLPKLQPTAKITAKIIDETNQPVAGAEVVIDFLVGNGGWSSSRDLSHKGITSSEGTFTASDQCGIAAALSVGKVGCYRTVSGYYLFKEKKFNRWQPWNPTVEMVLKPIVNPIPMYARRLDAVQIPIVGQPVGFDFIESDWVAPYGKGKVADFLFTLEKQYTSVEEVFDIKLSVRFTNEDDGIQSVFAPINEGSKLRLPRYAPEAGYLPELVKSYTRKTVTSMIERDFREDQNFFFRVRTVKKDGNIVSAHYGKIDGDIKFWDNEKLRFTYYLNPTSLDRNMEFDPKRNLLQNLKDSETVSNP